MVRKGKYKPSRGGPTYLNRDNVRLKVLMFLQSVGKSNQNKMMNDGKSGLRGQKWITLENILNDLCERSWIEKKQSDEAARVIIYQLLDKGRKIVEDVTNLQNNNSDLLNLDSFYGVKLGD